MQNRLIQIRHVPEKVHRTLKVRAAQQSMSLSDYLLKEIKQIAEQPTIEELEEQIRSRSRVDQSLDSVSAVRLERETRQ